MDAIGGQETRADREVIKLSRGQATRRSRMCPYSESAGRTTTLTEQWLLGAKPLFKVASWPSRLDGSCVDRSIALNRVTATEDMDGPTEDIRHFASMRFEATAPNSSSEELRKEHRFASRFCVRQRTDKFPKTVYKLRIPGRRVAISCLTLRPHYRSAFPPPQFIPLGQRRDHFQKFRTLQ